MSPAVTPVSVNKLLTNSTEPANFNPPIGAPPTDDEAGKSTEPSFEAEIEAPPMFNVFPLRYKSRKRWLGEPKSNSMSTFGTM